MVFELQGIFAVAPELFVWRTQFGWNGTQQTNSTFFEPLPSIVPRNHQFSIVVRPDEIVTITSLDFGPPPTINAAPPSEPFPSQYQDSFESYAVNSEANYFADQAGMYIEKCVLFGTHFFVRRLV